MVFFLCFLGILGSSCIFLNNLDGYWQFFMVLFFLCFLVVIGGFVLLFMVLMVFGG